MTIAEPATSEKAPTVRKLVLVEVEVPEDDVGRLEDFAAKLRTEPASRPKDFKEMLTTGPEWTDEFVALVNERDQRPARDVEL